MADTGGDRDSELDHARGVSGTRTATGGAAAPRLEDLVTFERLGPLVGDELAQLVGNLELQEGGSLTGAVRGARIAMSVPGQPAELRVTLLLEEGLVHMLAQVLMEGEARTSPEGARDMMRELANMAGGVVVREAAAEGVRVTSGLPVDDDSGAPRGGLVRHWTAEIAGSGLHLGLTGEVIGHRTLVLALSELQEGMVASRDVVDAGGVVLLPAGTRVTSSQKARLEALLGPLHQVAMMSPDD